jgi:hypothetical protein
VRASLFRVRSPHFPALQRGSSEDGVHNENATQNYARDRRAICRDDTLCNRADTSPGTGNRSGSTAAENLSPLSSRLAEINQLARQSLPIIVRHCGSDASCRKQQTAAMQELASKEAAVAKALRNPTTYSSAVVENDTINACKVMWRESEDFAATMQCINDATPTM